jgi:hypothetical protein
VTVFHVRASLFSYPQLFFMSLLLLVVSYWVGLMVELRQVTAPRLPPFAPKSAEEAGKQKYGWLGAWLASKIVSKVPRVMLAFLLWLSCQTRFLFSAYFFLFAQDDVGMASASPLICAALVFSIFMMIPNILVLLTTLPELVTDWRKGKSSEKAYSTGPYEVAALDDDLRITSDLRQQLCKHMCRSITVVIPCYMPNEESIIFEVLSFYRTQATEYPGELRVMVVWNSPHCHPEVEDELSRLEAEWAALTVHYNFWSTSKSDNLNMAIDLLETEIALLNDADTMVSAASMCRASMHIEAGYDIAQSHNLHCWMDTVGRPESGRFVFGSLATLADSTKPANMSTQGFFGHSPFNGRGGFWRVSALKKTGFDHQTVGEDHDAAYRGFACFGLRGILDNNMLCQEREPPSFKALVSQRIRWETAALQMRRTFVWILRSPHYSAVETFVLMWSSNTNMPLQQLPMQMASLLASTVLWNGLSVWDPRLLASAEPGRATVALQVATVMFIAMVGLYLVLVFGELCLRCLSTRYRPRWLWSFFVVVLGAAGLLLGWC